MQSQVHYDGFNIGREIYAVKVIIANMKMAYYTTTISGPMMVDE